jgi:hypothetical protein
MSEREARIQEKLTNLRSEMAGKIKKFDRPIVCWRPVAVERAEGETWTDDDGREWIVKDGLKQTVDKMREARTPWWCPKCSKSMAHRFDNKFYGLYNMCYNCSIDMHTQMMLDGTWDAFEKERVRQNEMAWLRDHISECEDYIRTFKVPQVHFENGGWEEIANINQFKEMFDSLRENITFCKTRLVALESESPEVKENSNDS